MLVLQGPNLNLVGTREPERYGTQTLEEIMGDVQGRASRLGHETGWRQSDHEGELLGWLHEAAGSAGFIILITGATIITMDAGKYLTVYTTALRGGGMGPTFGDRAGDEGAVPFIPENIRESRMVNIRLLYLERSFYLDNTSGVWIRTGQSPRIVAVAANDEVTDGPYS